MIKKGERKGIILPYHIISTLTRNLIRELISIARVCTRVYGIIYASQPTLPEATKSKNRLGTNNKAEVSL